jgi:hypothetical protein
MACDSASVRTSEGSHFSGRPPPPYHLYDVLKEFHTKMITTAEQPGIVIKRPQSPETLPDTTLDEGSSKPLMGLKSASVARGEVVQLFWSTGAQKPSASEVSSSDDGGCILPFSSTSSSQYPHHSVVIDTLREGETSIKLTPTVYITPEQSSPPATRVLHKGNPTRSATVAAKFLSARNESVHFGRAHSSHMNFQKYANHRRLQERIRNRKKSVDGQSDGPLDMNDHLSIVNPSPMTDTVDYVDDNMSFQSKDEEKVYSCIWFGCDRVFYLEAALNSHLTLAHIDSCQVCPVRECSRRISMKSVLGLHLLCEHGVPEDFLRGHGLLDWKT